MCLPCRTDNDNDSDNTVNATTTRAQEGLQIDDETILGLHPEGQTYLHVLHRYESSVLHVRK